MAFSMRSTGRKSARLSRTIIRRFLIPRSGRNFGPRRLGKKRSGREQRLPKEQSHLESKQLESSINTYDAVTGQGERKLQSWLNFAFALSIVIFLSCFLIGALTVSRDDPHPLRQMWVMAFGALSGLGDMIFAIYARQKEPKDHTLYAVIGGTILLVLGILLSLTALA
jgi:hypothetical protein